MANDILDHSSNFNQSESSEAIYCLEFNRSQWDQFWQLLITGSVMSDCLMSYLPFNRIFKQEIGDFICYVERWLELSQQLMPVFEAAKIVRMSFKN